MSHSPLAKPNLIIRQYQQLTSYADRFQEMKHFSEQRHHLSSDQVWLLQHHPVLTQGQAGKPEHILKPSDLPIIQSDRGGQVTWHGPGQLVIYIMFDLNRLGWNVRTLVSFAEKLMIDLLKKYQINAYAKADAPGVYVNEKKIGSLGFKIRRGCSYHGLALNLNCELTGFETINPCGYSGLEMVRLSDLLAPPPSYNRLCSDVIRYFKNLDLFNEINVTSL